jgi:hypothetical protein
MFIMKEARAKKKTTLQKMNVGVILTLKQGKASKAPKNRFSKKVEREHIFEVFGGKKEKTQKKYCLLLDRRFAQALKGVACALHCFEPATW